jgi:hypothetical protein
MKNRIAVLLVISTVFFSCKKTETTVVEKPTTPEVYNKISTECYAYTKGKDTITANLTIEGDSVNGNLAYKFFEKDKSSGPVVGTIKGDTLLLEYTFQSEGSQSILEVAFLRKNNKLTEGYGDIEDINGKVTFKNKKQLQFSGTVLNKISCN